MAIFAIRDMTTMIAIMAIRAIFTITIINHPTAITMITLIIDILIKTHYTHTAVQVSVSVCDIWHI